MTLVVSLDGTDVSGVAIRGSATRRLNRPSLAQITIPMDSAIGGAGSALKISFDGGATLFHHGRVMDCETDSGEDEGFTVYNSSDPMELWAWRPARDGPGSLDPGDFSNPLMFSEFPTGPQLIEQMLLQSQDDSDPALGEGPLFLTLGTFAVGGVNLSGGPTDWPMTIAQVVSLLVSTGEVDVVIPPTDPGGGIMGTVDVYNGNFGTDLSGSIVFQHGLGALNVRRMRWNEDMSSMCTKLWYYGGPRIQTAVDPEGNQHWCWNITADDPALDVAPFGPARQAAIEALRDAARITYGVRMDIKIYDAVSDLCLGKGSVDPGRDLYRALWQIEQWIRAQPRELIHITPIAGAEIGTFDIGGLVGVEAAAYIRGGFSGAQRVYEYTISWDEDGPFALSELQTSPNNEGI